MSKPTSGGKAGLTGTRSKNWHEFWGEEPRASAETEQTPVPPFPPLTRAFPSQS